MKGRLIHFVPFDTGTSFNTYSNLPQMNAATFSQALKSSLGDTGNVEVNIGKQCICTIHLAYDVTCYIMDNGIGVFVIPNTYIDMHIPKGISQEDFALKYYYLKKKEQTAILQNEVNGISNLLQKTMAKIWGITPKKIRTSSACRSYKYHGFSYVYTIYDITVDTMDDEFLHQMHHLLYPTQFQNILTETDYATIAKQVKEKRDFHLEFPPVTMGDDHIYASWSGAAIISTQPNQVNNILINMQLQIQSTWFLFDCTLDHIHQGETSRLELRQIESILKFAELTSMTMISANMSTAEQKCFQLLHDTSGIETVMNNTKLLIENRLIIEEQKVIDSQKMFSKLTEILLAIIAIFSIYEPIKNMIQSNFMGNELYIILSLASLAFVAVILLLKKG